MDVIASIKKERGYFRLTLDSGESIMVSGELFRERPFAEGDEIDLEAYDEWLLPRQYRAALDRAVAMLAARAHSRGEIEQKLLRAHFRPATVEMVLYKLQRENLLDDADFARQWAAARTNRKLGRNRIAQELRRKGVSASDIEEALSDIDGDDQLDAAVSLVEKALNRAKPGEDPRKTAQRIAGMLARRGYPWDVAREAIQRAMQELED